LGEEEADALQKGIDAFFLLIVTIINSFYPDFIEGYKNYKR